MTSFEGTFPIETPTTPPSLTKPLPVIITIVPGQFGLVAVTTWGTAAFPPPQLVMVAAPSEPATARPTATTTKRHPYCLSDTRVEPLPVTREPSLLRNGWLEREPSENTTLVLQVQRRISRRGTCL